MQKAPNLDYELLEMHERLLAGDPTVTCDIFNAVAPPLIRYLRARFPSLAPSVDPEAHTDAAHEALTDYFKNPDKFDPDRSGLMGYLRMAAYRDMQNLLSKESRHARGRIPLDDVVFDLDDGNDIAEAIADQMDADSLRRELSADMNEQESIVFDLMVEGERSAEAAAAALGIAHLPVPEQRREVKRIKDRLRRRLQRRKGSVS